ncbi:MAG: hypothetical protein JST44_21745 [Cyanobacteria bacterium SZAS LIN-5]|nr:hypothetical protein [Cyanobacteria bacterium SZAS LIN-5]RTL43175.1 MAG: hypothetical protein EKK48_09780 [Candidatus Melainabacteria bacterium]
MSDTVKNDSLNNFETNRDQDLGKAIADAANALSKAIRPENEATGSKTAGGENRSSTTEKKN